MNLSINTKQITTAIVQFLHRYHVVIFTLTAIGGLAVATFMLNAAINVKPDATQTSISQQFDTETMDKIKALNKAGESAPSFTLPPGRSNPFQSS